MNHIQKSDSFFTRGIALLLTLAVFIGMAEPSAFAEEEHEHQYAPTEYVVEPTCTEPGYTAYVCTVCGDVQPWDLKEPLGHAWDDGTVVTEPTETTEGATVYTCTRCGVRNPVFIPASGSAENPQPTEDPNAPPVPDTSVDLEGPPIWERPFENLMLTGKWADDFLTVVQTQMWYAESEDNFEAVWDEDSQTYIRHGYTRYGAWYGMPYGDWCAMFLSFCLKYASVPQSVIPWEASSENWAAALLQKGMFGARGSYTPKPGDLIFFDDDCNGYADHCGVVYQTDASTGMVYTVEGNRTDDVRSFSYSLLDNTITGYGIMPENPNPKPHLALEPVPEADGEKKESTEASTQSKITTELGSFTPDAPVAEGTSLSVIPVEVDPDVAAIVRRFASDTLQAEAEEIHIAGYTVFLARPDNTVAPVGAEVTLNTSITLPAIRADRTDGEEFERELPVTLKEIVAVYVKDDELRQVPATAATENGTITSVTFHVPEAATFALCYTVDAAEIEETPEGKSNPEEEETTEQDETEELVAFRGTAEVAGGSITVTAGEGVLAEGVKLQVTDPTQLQQSMRLMAAPSLRTQSISSMTLEESAASPADVQDADPIPSEQTAEAEEETVVVARYEYDISLLDADGNPTQPNGNVTLRFALPEANNVNYTATVYHETAEGNIPLNTETDVDKGEVVALTDGFSTFIVEFSYRKETYILEQGKSVTLRQLFSGIGMTFNIGEIIKDAEITGDGRNNITLEKNDVAYAEGWIITPNPNLSQADMQKTATLTIKTGVSILAFIPASTYEITIKVSEEKTTVDYLERNDNDRTGHSETYSGAFTRVMEGGEKPTEFKNGWYVFRGTVIYGGRIDVTGSDVHFILTDGCAVNVTGGIHIASGAHLTIYGQAKESGVLNCSVTSAISAGGSWLPSIGDLFGTSGIVNAAGIGGNGNENSNGKLTVKSGTVISTGGDGGAGIGAGHGGTFGEITIYGGKITATGKDGAGIGSGRVAGPSGTITIKGGTVNASGGEGRGAGIGGGNGDGKSYGFGNIVIEGGTITAQGGDYAAGIGFGHHNYVAGSVLITGGTVTATGGKRGAGIGGSEDRSGCVVTISGGTVTAKGGAYSAGIGGGEEGSQGGKVTISGGNVTATGEMYAAGIGGGGRNSDWIFHPKYKCDGGEVEIRGGTVTANSIYYVGAGIGGGYGGVNGPITITGGTVTATAGSELKELNHTGAAIGSSSGLSQGGPIVITGGKVIAKNLGRGAAIGGGFQGNGGVVTISGDTVVLAFAADGAGIGGGSPANESSSGGNGGTVTINGGEVMATSTGRGAGIGGGRGGSGGSLTMNNGYLFASGGDYIYNWAKEHKSMLKPNFFPKNAYASIIAAAIPVLFSRFFSGSYGGAGIGGGHGGSGGTVVINGGTVVAVAKLLGASAIGGGYGNDNHGNLKIYDAASVSVGETLDKIKLVGKEKRVEECRANVRNRNLVAAITLCDHGAGEDSAVKYIDKNARVHDLSCPYCYSKGKDLESDHVFDKTTHTCVCGHKEYQLTTQTEGEGTVSVAISDSKGEVLKSGDYVSSGETIRVTATPKEAELNTSLNVTLKKDGKDEPVRSEVSGKKESTLENTYVMPSSDITVKGIFAAAKPDPVKISFHSAYEPEKKISLQAEFGENIKLPDSDNITLNNTPGQSFTVPAGKTFEGWTFAGDEDGHVFHAGVLFPAEYDTDFVAKWYDAYPVWVRGKQITEFNREDVLGDGKVTFYPEYDAQGNVTAGELVLHSAVIAGTDDSSYYSNCLIYAAGIDLTVSGSAMLQGSSERSGICLAGADTSHTMTMDADLTLSGFGTAIDNGTKGMLIFNSGAVTAEQIQNSGIHANGTISISNNVNQVEVNCGNSSNEAIKGARIELEDDLFIKEPADGSVDLQSGKIKAADGSNPRHVLIVPKEHLPVQLRWNDGLSADNSRVPVTIVLKRDEDVISTVELNQENGWAGDLLKTPIEGDVLYEIDENNELIPLWDHSAEEEGKNVVSLGGNRYLAEMTGNDDGTAVLIINTPARSVSGYVEWDDQADFDTKRPGIVSLALQANGVTASQIEVEQKASDTDAAKWAWRFEDLPVYDEDGNQIFYTVRGQGVENYLTSLLGSVENGFRVVYSYIYLKFAVTKIWNEVPADKIDKIPEILNLTIRPNGREEGKFSFTMRAPQDISDPDSWTEIIMKDGQLLPKYDSRGRRIVYTVSEEFPENSEFMLTAMKPRADGAELTNTYNPETVFQTVYIDWDDEDNQDGVRPVELTARLMAGGIPYEDDEGKKITVPLNEANNWTGYTEGPVPLKNSTGEKIDYTWTITDLPSEYEVLYQYTEDLVTYIVLSHDPAPVDITVKKVWDDKEDQDGIRPESLLIRLLADGEVADTAYLEPTENAEEGAESWSFTFTDFPRKVNGSEVNYTVEEEELTGYTKRTILSGSENNEKTFTLTNTHTPETMELFVTIDWLDDNNIKGNRPGHVTVQLIDDTGKIGEVTLNEENGWTESIGNLPVYRNGEEIVYTWKPVGLEDLEAYVVEKDDYGPMTELSFIHTGLYSTVLTAPAAVSGLVYNGKGQILVMEGTAYHGTMLYSLSENGPFSEALPVGTDAGTYNVYYRVKGDEHYYDSDVYGPVPVPVGKAKLTSATINETLLFYSGEEQRVSVTGVKAGDLAVPEAAYTVSGNAATAVGDYAVTVTAVENSNFQGSVTVQYSMLQVPFTGYYYSATTGIWMKHSQVDAPFRVSRADRDELTYRLFRYVAVDDRIVSSRNYEKTEGSIIITLKSSYLETLDIGWHKLTTVFNDGKVDTVFLVVSPDYDGRTYPNPYPDVTGYTYVNPTNNPRTGDESNVVLWVGLAMVSALVAASGFLFLRKRRRKTEQI